MKPSDRKGVRDLSMLVNRVHKYLSTWLEGLSIVDCGIIVKRGEHVVLG